MATSDLQDIVNALVKLTDRLYKTESASTHDGYIRIKAVEQAKQNIERFEKINNAN